MLTLEHKLPGSFAQLSNVVELGSGRVVFADTRSKLFLSADLASGDVDTLGTRVETITAQSPADQYKFPGLGRPSRRRYRGAGGLRRAAHHPVGRARQRAQGARHGARLPVPRPCWCTTRSGHAYKIDYQQVLGEGARCHDRPGQHRGAPHRARARARWTRSPSSPAPEYGEAVFGEQRQRAVKVFAPNDFFGVLPSGVAWVARGRENRVDWRDVEGPGPGAAAGSTRRCQ